MAKSESDVKTEFVKAVRRAGGWGRRHEDQYAVGILDVEVVLPPTILAWSPVFLIEAKLVRNQSFGPSERQYVEMIRVLSAQLNADRERVTAVPVLMGYKDGIHMFHSPTKQCRMEDCEQQQIGQSPIDTLTAWYTQWLTDGK